MPDKCCVPKCNSNYATCGAKYTPVFRFPQDENLKRKWIQNINREDWVPSKWSVVCAKHFPEDMISSQTIIKDSNGTGRKLFKSKIKLRTGAVPQIFLSNSIPKIEEPSDPLLHREKLFDLDEAKNNGWLQSDLIKNFTDFCNKLLKKQHIHVSWKLHRDINFVVFYSCDFNGIIPQIVSSIKILNDMTCSVVVNNSILSKSQLKWILPQNLKITHWSQIEIILACYKKDNIKKSN
ncbi:uncharacterized protein LOC143209798 [Lasioglossum baleicum]|uniref:uncharacterized protein LOC143209798 n=1 Tax=Lasioglossum baleicum TaxID=434251 RepID=UPI003FCE2FA5